MSDKEFDEFWRAFPIKVGKQAARKSFKKAIRQTDIQTILAAVEKYKRCKPDWQHFCHPTSWLNQGRWEDDWSEPFKQQTGGAPRSFDTDKVYDMTKLTKYRPAFLQEYEKKEA